jgi:hypothetical protein
MAIAKPGYMLKPTNSNQKMSLKATTTATNGHYIVATLYDELCRSNEAAEAQLISVESPAGLRKVQVPAHLKQLLMTARTAATQLRFNLTFDMPLGSRLPIISSASLVPRHTYLAEAPIPTNVVCGFCLQEPYDVNTGKWLPNVYRLAARDGASELKIELYYKCVGLLRARSILPLDDDTFRFRTTAFHSSDADLLQNVAHQRWLLRATLPTLYFRSCEGGQEKAPLLTMRSEVQHENIKRLQNAVKSSFASCAKLGQRDALVNFVQVGGRRRSCQESDMDLVLDVLKNARGGTGHPLIGSFEAARRRQCTAAMPELPFTIAKQPNSFSVLKVYLVKIDERHNWRSRLSHDSLLMTTEYSCTGHLWTPNLQRLLDDMERRGPKEFSEIHAHGIQFKRENEPVSLCLQRQAIEGEHWFQRNEHAGGLQARKQPVEDCDHVWSSDFSALVHQVAVFGLRDAADGA